MRYGCFVRLKISMKHMSNITLWGWQSINMRVNPKNNIYSSLSFSLFSLWKFQFLQNFYRKNQFFLATIRRHIVSFSTLSCSKSLMAVYKGKRNSRCKSFSMIHFDCVESTDKLAHKAIVWEFCFLCQLVSACVRVKHKFIFFW